MTTSLAAVGTGSTDTFSRNFLPTGTCKRPSSRPYETQHTLNTLRSTAAGAKAALMHFTRGQAAGI